MRWQQAAVAAMLLIAACPVQAAEPRQPTARWVVDFDEAQCVASRNYGSEDKPIFLVLKAPPLGGVLQIGVVRTGLPRQAMQIDGEVIFDQNPPIRTNLLEYGLMKLKQRVLLVNLPLRDLAPMRQATSVHIRARQDLQPVGSRINQSEGGIDMSFALTQMSALLETLEACVVDLKKVWNVSRPGAGESNFRQPVRGNLQGVIRPEDYPGVALQEDQQGTVTFMLLIDETGRVADCAVIGTSGAASLDAQSCATVKERAKFTPAIGMDGKPGKASFTQRVTWRIRR